MKSIFALFYRDLLLSYRQGIDIVVMVLFFLGAGALFAFALGPSRESLAPASAGIALVMAAFAALLSFDRLFQSDLEDGSLDQLILSPLPLELVVLVKALTHWLLAGVPLLVAAIPLSFMMLSDSASVFALCLALLLVTPALSLLGTLGATLTLEARRSGLLLAFLVLPLFVPILIFGAAIAQKALFLQLSGQNSQYFPLIILGAIDLGLLASIPWAGAAALRLIYR